MTEAQKCLYHIAENMRMAKSISKEGYEYFQQAIKALEQEPCEDCISRQAVLDMIYNVDGMEGFENSNIFAKHYVNNVKALPSVTPQQNVGKWMIHPNGVYAHLVCSKCLTNAPYDCKTNYCPTCGAKMEVE